MYFRVASVLCFFASAATADVPAAELAVCAAHKGDLNRLSCFDNLAKMAGLDGPQQVETDTSGVGKWHVERTKNPIDDSETVVLVLVADQGKSGFGQPVALYLRCQSSNFEFYIAWNDYLASDGEFGEEWKNVIVRHGSGSAATEQWSTSTDQKATFAFGSHRHLQELMRNSSFVAQITPYNSSPITAVFDTTGLKEAVGPLVEVCNLKVQD